MNQTDVSPRSRSIMVVSEREAFARVMSEAFSTEENYRVTNEQKSFNAMNGQAVNLAFNYDVVIFEADPDDQNEVRAIEELLSQRTGETVFLALTGNDVSISKARQLRGIGIDEVLPLSIDRIGLKAAIDERISARRVPHQLVQDSPSALGQVIPVTQSRGGVGATTVAVNLACSLAGGQASLFRKADKRRVALLDLDIQFGNSNVFLDIEDNGGLLKLIESIEEPDDHFFASTLQSHALGIDVLCAPVPIVPLQSVRPDLVENMLAMLQKNYDYIIVDLPRAVADWVEPVLKCAAHLVLVTDTSVPSVRQARRLIDLYHEENVGLPVEVVVNRDRQPLMKSEHVREAEKVLETKFRHWLPSNPKVARTAVDLGRPIVDMKPRSDLGKAITKMAATMSAENQHTKRMNV